jgi:hypothetical protein
MGFLWVEGTQPSWLIPV